MATDLPAAGGEAPLEQLRVRLDDLSRTLGAVQTQLRAVVQEAHAAGVAADGAKEAAVSAAEAAGAAKNAFEAAQRIAPPPGALPRGTLIGPALFGAVIGVLTSLSAQVGTTATLIGLLFAAIGGSLLVWYRNDGLPAADRSAFLCSLGGLSGGLLGGLLIAFVGRAYEAGWFSPLPSAGESTAIASSRQSITIKAFDIARTQLDGAARDGKAIAESDFASIERLLRIGDEQAAKVKEVSVANRDDGIGRQVIVLQAKSAAKVDEVIADLNELRGNAKADEDKINIIDQLLLTLRKAREKLAAP